MKNLTDIQNFALLSENKSLDSLDLYRACVVVACHGLSRDEEQTLPCYAQELLQVRRFLYSESLDEADFILHKLRYQNLPEIFNADRVFLEGQVLHKRGFQKEALLKMHEAADMYHLCKDYFRELRARSNAYIAVCDLQMCLIGELLAIEQKARRLGYFEIAANICRARAEELMQAGKFAQAHQAAEEAISLYANDGYPDDQAVAIYLSALCLLMLGHPEDADKTQLRAKVSDGKVLHFANAYFSLKLGKLPNFPYQHPMSKVPWKINFVKSIKSSSIPGKIIEALNEGPKSRDELITVIWGDDALDPSYTNRLHSALSAIKKNRKIQIRFDGERYLLSS